ncbi:MAG: hypothetical protein ACI841_005391 [Planctomycetota bacterium]|jgi:hypothetical protein
MATIVHELSWSSSRAGTFAECKRRYYYDYYLSWTGWKSSADPIRRQAWLLKKMTRLPMLAGEVLHNALESYFQQKEQGHVASEQELVNQAVTQLRTGYKESRDGTWKRRPARMTRLAEHHYAEASIDESTGAAGDYGKRFVERIRGGLSAFFALEELQEVRAVEPARFLACEEMGTIELFGTRVFAIPDFAFERQPSDVEGAATRVHIWDWKTGQPRAADEFQLAVYVLYAGEKWGSAPLEVTCTDAYLPTRELRTMQFDDESCQATLGKIENSLTEMKAIHFDADAGVGDSESFPMIPEDSDQMSRSCGSCNYRELCNR